VLANCFTADAHCGHANRCTVRKPLKKIHEAILRLLSSVSIQDMLQDSDDRGLGSIPVTLIGLQGAPKALDAQSYLRK
jgi:DNA-binding IscR family transcriptional regulator